MKNTVYLFTPDSPGTIAPEIYGHFSEHIGGVFYDGLWVGKDSKIPNIHGFRKSVIDKMREIKAPVLRWPGGCFAETYNWRDGIGENRPVRRNWWTPDDGRLETNEVGTNEFLDLCELIGAKPYVAVNVTSTTPLDIREWMDYCLSPENTTTLSRLREKNGRRKPFVVPFWGVGNENWGGGGSMTGETYAHIFKRYATVMRNTAPDVKFIAGGSNGSEYAWLRLFLESLEVSRDHFDWTNAMNGISFHYYVGGKFSRGGDAVAYTDEEWDELIEDAGKMEEILCRHWAALESYGRTDSKLVVDEWGCWHPDGSGPSKGKNLFEQQSTMRDAVVAALTLNIFNNHCDKVQMANCAQLVNNIHCLFLTSGDKFTVTPTFHVFNMYKEHQGARCIRTFTEGAGELSVSASEKDGRCLITIANTSCRESAEITLSAVGKQLSNPTGELLAAKDLRAVNTFEVPETIRPEIVKIGETITIPAGGILAIRGEMQ